MVTVKAALSYRLELEVHQLIHNESEQRDHDDELKVPVARNGREDVSR